MGEFMDRKYVMTALGYAIIGLILGIIMAATKNHGHMVTHAHIMLLGFVVSFVYAVCHKLWLGTASAKLSAIQFYLHQIGSLVLLASLFAMYSGLASPAVLMPFLAVSSILVLVAMILMKVMFIKSR